MSLRMSACNVCTHAARMSIRRFTRMSVRMSVRMPVRMPIHTSSPKSLNSRQYTYPRACKHDLVRFVTAHRRRICKAESPSDPEQPLLDPSATITSAITIVLQDGEPKAPRSYRSSKRRWNSRRCRNTRVVMCAYMCIDAVLDACRTETLV